MRRWWRRRAETAPAAAVLDSVPLDESPTVNPWVAKQVGGVKALAGNVVLEWVGVEMAVRSNEDETEFQFTDPQVPCLQLWGLTVELDSGGVTRFSNYQNDGEFGLEVIPRGAPLDDLYADGYRLRSLDELPLGVVASVVTRLSDEGDLTEIELIVGGEFLLLVAGETYETWTERIEIRRFDESILVFRSQADYDSIDWISPERPGTTSSEEMTTMRDRPLAQEGIQNIYELTSLRFGPVPGGGWSMASRFFYRCPECGYLMQGGEDEENCSCGNMYRDVGRFGARTGDDSIEVFEARSRRTGEYA